MRLLIITILASCVVGAIGSMPLIGPGSSLFTSAVNDTKKHRHKHKTTTSSNESSVITTPATLPTTSKLPAITATFSYAPTSAACTTSTIHTTIATASAPRSPTTVLETTTLVQPGTTKIQIEPASETEGASLNLCYSANQSVLNGKAPASCGAAFQQISDCYTNISPGSNPYDVEQNNHFRSCICEERPFTENSTFYLLWAGCLHCILMASAYDPTVMAQNMLLVESFCDTQEPDAYLLLSQILSFFSRISGEATTPVTYPVLPSVTAGVQQMGMKYTTTPPLANLAWGTSAPNDGTLKGVIPVLTTLTSHSATITGVVRWIPTSGEAYDPVAASESAKSAALSIIRESYTAEISVKTANPTACYGRGPCSNVGERGRRLDVGLALGGLGLAIGVVMLVL